MAPQVKLLANGIKAVLTAQRGSKPGLLQVFDKDNCMIAHREVLSKVNKQGERTLEKLTLRDNKYMDQQIEYLETTTRKDGSWSSSRTVDIYGDCYINYNDIKSGKKSVDYYKEESPFGKSYGYCRNFPLLKSTRTTTTKAEEIDSTLSLMLNQWFKPGYIERETPRPLLTPAKEKMLFLDA